MFIILYMNLTIYFLFINSISIPGKCFSVCPLYMAKWLDVNLVCIFIEPRRRFKYKKKTVFLSLEENKDPNNY